MFSRSRGRLLRILQIPFLCALVAISVRAATPSGFMVARAGDLFSVTLCGDKHAFDDSPRRTGERDLPGGGEQDICPFAVGASAVLTLSPVAAKGMVTVAPQPGHPVFLSLASARPGLAAPPPQSHAPPARV